MIYVATAVIAGLAVFIGFVVVMAPRHWEMYHENIDLKAALTNVGEERDHYKNLVKPSEWGAEAQREARIVKTQPWDDYEAYTTGEVEHVFDDIKNGGE